MFSKNKSTISGSQSFKSQTSLKKKNPAPPRPPQPSSSRLLLTSQSFGTVDELNSRSHSGFTIAGTRPNFNVNLIDFSAPEPRPKSQPADLIASTQPDPPEFRYRVAASIFYIKSPLVNFNSGVPDVNPFSPPRPSAQSLSTTVKSSNVKHESSSTIKSTTVTTSTKYISNPTIIKSQTTITDAQSQSQQQSTTTQSSHSNSTTATTAQRTKYGNIPLQWDEPPKRIPVPIAPLAFPMPTVIKPALPPKKVGLIPTKSFVPTTVSTMYDTPPEPRNYYDEPPGFDDDDDDDDDYDDFESKPMPNIPPPPLPSDTDLGQGWGDESNANAVSTYNEPYTECYGSNGNRAYAIALYDYVPEADGDLALQMGDLVYLLRKIDDSWLFGVCGGIEGMFPTNYVNVVVPLPDEEELQVPELTSQVESEYAYHYVNVLYPFTAETESDLNLQIEDVVGVLGRINDDWLYGEISGSRGQFPESFVSPVPMGLPIITL